MNISRLYACALFQAAEKEMRIERQRLLGLAVWLAVLVGSASTLSE